MTKFDFQSQVSMSKIIEIFLIFFSLKITNLEAHFLLLTFLTAHHYSNSQNSMISFVYVDF